MTIDLKFSQMRALALGQAGASQLKRAPADHCVGPLAGMCAVPHQAASPTQRHFEHNLCLVAPSTCIHLGRDAVAKSACILATVRPYCGRGASLTECGPAVEKCARSVAARRAKSTVTPLTYCPAAGAECRTSFVTGTKSS